LNEEGKMADEPIMALEEDIIKKMDDKTRSRYLSFKSKVKYLQIAEAVLSIISFIVLGNVVWYEYAESQKTYGDEVPPPSPILPVSMLILMIILFIVVGFIFHIRSGRDRWAKELDVSKYTIDRWIKYIFGI
jgi:p-aminobenzoyl-glutamate transporter AbgT